MFELNTERLRIIPLELKYFKLLLEDTKKMEKSLKLSYSGEILEGHVKEAMEGLYKEALKNNEKYIWYTNWQIILKEENISIGSACFMKRPDINGNVEIGYGINSKYQNKGYMTEALNTICNWAFEQPGISSIIAETDKTNIPSHKVLKKVGMKMYTQTEESFWWKL